MSSYLPIKSLHVIFINFIVVFKLVSFSIVGKILKSTRTWRYLVPVLRSHYRKVPIKIGLSLKTLFKNLKIIRMGDLLEWYVGYCFIFCQKIKLLTAPINVSQMLLTNHTDAVIKTKVLVIVMKLMLIFGFVVMGKLHGWKYFTASVIPWNKRNVKNVGFLL